MLRACVACGDLLAIECRYAWNGDGYWWLIFGQAISATAQVVALLSVPCVSCKWFGWHQRLSATAIGLSGKPRRLPPTTLSSHGLP